MMLRYQPELGILTGGDIRSGCHEGLGWRGTPHRNRIARPGPDGGIDCLHLVSRIMIAAWMIPEFQFPYYHHAVGLREKVNIMEGLFVLCCDADVLDPSEPVTDGDVMVFKSGKITNHTGIIMGGHMYESSCHFGVRIRKADRYPVDLFQSFCRLRSRGFRRRPESLTREELYAAIGRTGEVKV